LSSATPWATKRAYRPERFLGTDTPDTYTWLPFGGGTRRCLGASFATFETQVVIRRVLESTRLATVGRPERTCVEGSRSYLPGVFWTSSQASAGPLLVETLAFGRKNESA
jgi:hypothetical protein